MENQIAPLKAMDMVLNALVLTKRDLENGKVK